MRSKHSKCCFCGAWKPIPEMKLHMIIEPITYVGPVQRVYECKEHNEAQKHRHERAMFKRLRELWYGEE